MAGMLLLNDDARAALGSLETLLIGGEAFPLSLATELRELVNGPILNMYGPTETTIWSSSYTLDGIRGSVPIGKPIANTAMYVLDANMQPVPVAVPGELFIGGAGVVRGYHGRPELTAERFVPDPFQGNGARMYRTGDLARYRDDGTIEFLGRLDHQVKVRGYRIELGEIEAALSADPSVRETVVVAREDAPGDRRLVAYVVPRGAGAADAHAMRERLRGALPEYMVPSHVILMDAFPQTPNAKVDRKALPAPHEAVAPVAAVFVPPEHDVERVIAEIWRELLNIPRVGAQDNFFDLGGHSLLAVQAHRRMRDAIKPDLSITDLFRFPTVRALADFITSSGASDNAKRAEDRAETRRDALRRRMARRDRVVEPHSAAVEERD
jgi:acyl-coenzyme A synthetase/AMP-(fatty) acid ligase